MSSTCISRCGTDARNPVRATYLNVYKWPESDAAFLRSVGSKPHPRVVDSISCRQLYLRSYTFSRKETVPQKTKKCFGRVRERVALHRKKRKCRGVRRRCTVLRRAKELTCSALLSIFHRLLSCTTKVDVVDRL
ncbi:hypothetical protein PVL29_007405 [Vitis rotundifolia]|uniref:Uncharacterized protein n=1 Tax=Vitis rotundifolia TaxID=103349 RepID=A0AA39DY79_VITRO|nr:hypothetical protein PVL29_007405 [Vitis rotundifolia]